MCLQRLLMAIYHDLKSGWHICLPNSSYYVDFYQVDMESIYLSRAPYEFQCLQNV